MPLSVSFQPHKGDLCDEQFDGFHSLFVDWTSVGPSKNAKVVPGRRSLPGFADEAFLPDPLKMNLDEWKNLHVKGEAKSHQARREQST